MISDAETPLVPELAPLPPHMLADDGSPLTRQQIRERCKMAFISGDATLAQLSVKYSVPYHSIAGWSSDDEWGAIIKKADQIVANKLPSKLAEVRLRLQLEEEETALRRVAKLRAEIDRKIDSTDKPLEMSELRDGATAEEKLNAIVRRTLDLDGESRGGTKVNMNIMGDINLVSGS